MILKNLFQKVAALPLIGPHGDREADLLLAGAKPAGIFQISDSEHPQEQKNSEDLQRLDNAVAQGKLISRQITNSTSLTNYIYTLPGREPMHGPPSNHHTNSERFKKILYDFNKHAFTFLKIPFTNRIVSDASIKAHYLEEQRKLRVVLEGKADSIIIPEGSLSLTPAGQVLQKELDALTADGTLLCKKDVTEHTSKHILYGQPSRLADIDLMAELLTQKRDNIYDKEVGRLLGYTKRDQEFYLSRGQNLNPVLRWALNHTNDFRRDLRIKMMLQDGPNGNP